MNTIKSVYFIGIGGIGMSNLARYFMMKGKKIAGYDRTSTKLTNDLEKEGALIHFDDNANLIPEFCRNANDTLVVYTPAVPSDSKELAFFRNGNFKVQKRAEVLGIITIESKALCCGWNTQKLQYELVVVRR